MIIVSDIVLDRPNKNFFPPVDPWLEIITPEDASPLGLWTCPRVDPTNGKDLARKDSPKTPLPWAILNAIRMEYVRCSASVLKSMGPIHTSQPSL